MKNLLYKEFKLALHPASVMFLALSAMLIIPNYPYYVTFFYTALGIFFICLTGRENNDIFYSVSLPVRKRDVVKARITFAVILELIQILLAVPFAFIRQSFSIPGNQVGMDANIALLGLSLIMLGLFNLVFFTKYYERPDKVGVPFVYGSTVIFLFICIAETCTHIIPFFRDKLDTPDTQYIPEKLAVLVIGAAIFGALTFIASKLSQKKFNALDL